MDDVELEQLLSDMESDRVERKEAAKDVDKIAQAICAFSNDLADHRKPGVIFVGERDKGGHAGHPVTDQLLRDLAAIRRDGNIQPIPRMDVQKRTLLGQDYAVVIVHPAVAPPVSYQGRIWVRVGPSRARASEQEERELRDRRLYRQTPYDLQPVDGATLDDLNLSFFREEYLPRAVASDVLADNHRSIEEQLASLRFVAGTADLRPTLAGLLVAGKDPRFWHPDAYVQFARFPGNELSSEVIDQTEIGGPLSLLINRLEEKLKSHNRESLSIGTGLTDVRTPLYPISALQQLFRNAIMHRSYDGTLAPVRVYWYADRVEITSPGGPVGGVTASNFGEPGTTAYRNPAIAEAMRNLGFVQRFGVGISSAQQDLSRNGNPPAEFTITSSFVLATVRGRVG